MNFEVLKQISEYFYVDFKDITDGIKTKNENIYWGEISFYKSILAAIIFSQMVLIIDQKNIPSQFICKYGMEEIIIWVFFGVLIISMCFGRRHISDLLKMPCGNAGDETFVFSVISFAPS